MMKKRFLCAILACILCLAGCAQEETPQDRGLYFTYNGTDIALNAPAQPILEALGTPKAKTEEPSCAFDGLDITYSYDGFNLQTYPMDGGEFIYGFWFTDSTVSNPEGISIGSGEAAVVKAYGEESRSGDNVFVVMKDGGRLTILLTDGRVSSIQYAIIL